MLHHLKRTLRVRFFICLGASAFLHAGLLLLLGNAVVLDHAPSADKPATGATPTVYVLKHVARQHDLRRRPLVREQAPPPSNPLMSKQERPSARFEGAGSTTSSRLANPLARHYFSPEEVTEPTHVISPIELSPGASTPPEGRLLLRILVNTQGTADQIEVEENTLSSELEQEATAKFSSAFYTIAKRGEMAVASWLRIEIVISNELTPATP